MRIPEGNIKKIIKKIIEKVGFSHNIKKRSSILWSKKIVVKKTLKGFRWIISIEDDLVELNEISS